MPTSSCIYMTLCLLLFHLPRVQGDAAYVYYENAECVSGNYIEGKLIFAYDTSSMSGRGFTLKNYNGPCKYFEGGRFDFMYGSASGSFMKNGYCVRCQGMIGCTTTKNSCKGFSTVIPSTPYTMTRNSTYEMDDDVDNDLDSNNGLNYNADDSIRTAANITDVDDSTEDFQVSEEMVMYEEAAFQELLKYNHGQSWIAVYSVIGIFCGMLSFMAIFATTKAIRRLNRRSGVVSKDSLMGNDYSTSDPEKNREVSEMMP